MSPVESAPPVLAQGPESDVLLQLVASGTERAGQTCEDGKTYYGRVRASEPCGLSPAPGIALARRSRSRDAGPHGIVTR